MRWSVDCKSIYTPQNLRAFELALYSSGLAEAELLPNT